MAYVAEPQRLQYPPSWERAPDRLLRLWQGDDRKNRGEVVRTSMMTRPNNPNNNCFTLGKTGADEAGDTVLGVGKGAANSVESVGVRAYLYKKDNCAPGTRRITVNEGQYIPKLSALNFANEANSVRIEWNEADKLPCCMGVKDFLDRRMCDYGWIATDKTDPASPCYEPILNAIRADPGLLEYGAFRDWCTETGACDTAAADFCEANPADPFCACLSSDIGGLAVCADPKCMNAAAYRTRAMARAEADCPDVMECKAYFQQTGRINIARGTSQDIVCNKMREQGLLGQTTVDVGVDVGTSTAAPAPSPAAPPAIWILLVILILLVGGALAYRRLKRNAPAEAEAVQAAEIAAEAAEIGAEAA